jgi:choline dehydrogenase-like flavoprotein
MNINIKAVAEHSYDAIVIGTGISGGWAAKELCEKGLKTLVLERGRDVKHIEDYPTAFMDPWQAPLANRVTPEEKAQHPIQSQNANFTQETKHWWINDLENPYTQIKKFVWIRGDHVGGKSLMWSRQVYRWSEMDFLANAKDGHGVPWPIGYADIAPWYDYVEKFIGVSGQAEGLAHLPDGQFLPPMEFTCIEKHLKQSIKKHFPERLLTIGRTTNITQRHNNRGPCLNRNRCNRGCPFGAYFSSNSSTLPAAAATGNMTLRPHSLVSEILFDSNTQRATGVRIVDTLTHEVREYFAKIIFVNGSTLATTQLLLSSRSERFPNGLGNDSGELGHNLMDHHHKVGASAVSDLFADQYYYGRRPNGIYIPRYRNITSQRSDYLRGFGFQGNSGRGDWERGTRSENIGAELKSELQQPGPWSMYLGGFGECLPYHENKVSLNFEVKDKWGLPTLNIDCAYRENEKKMRLDIAASAAEMLEAAGLQSVKPFNDENIVPGLGIHEMGTARMGLDPKTSVLNKHNQMHAVKNVFVTDGACMTSSACQNPSLTYMALTARAADFAVSELNKRNL